MRIKRTLFFWIILASFGFAWTLALPFEGTLLYALLERDSFLPSSLVFELVLAVCAGLASSGFWIKNRNMALGCIRLSLIFCLGVTLFAFVSSPWLRPLLWLGCFFMGISIASLAFYIVCLETPVQRYRVVADILIYGNVWMIASDMLTVNLSIEAGLIVCALALCVGLYSTRCLAQSVAESPVPKAAQVTDSSVLAPLAFLTVFITIICINSGLMYQVLVPAFSGVKAFASFYWAIPYIVAIGIMRRYPTLLSPKQALFAALSMNGLAFLTFGMLDRSLPSYLVVNTLMLFACGIYDLFWWSVLACLSCKHRNPALVFGIGLGGNVLGVLIGGIIGHTIFNIQSEMGFLLYAAPLSLFVICTLMTLLNPLHKLLRTHVADSPFLQDDLEKEIIKETIKETILVPVFSDAEHSALPDDLTEQEKRIAALIHKGRTYDMIAEELFISKNTVKFHIKNIYGKCGVKNKAEFIKFLKTAGGKTDQEAGR